MRSIFEKNWLVVGLGNPGPQYEKTRHNAGFMVVDRIARGGHCQVKREECRSLIGRTEIGEHVVELVKPQTYMNLSGESVKCLLKKDVRGVERIIVISDDLALPFGTVRIRPKGSHGGHNGLRSLIDLLGTSDFIRLRVGIMSQLPVSNTRDFVLQDFSKAESADLDNLLELCADAVRTVIENGVERAMAEFN